MKKSSEDILKGGKLSATQPRKKILNYLARFDEAVSGAELEKALHECCNRSTIYRNLIALSEAGLIHRIILEGESRYKIHPGLINENYDLNHPHFECMMCGQLFCLHNQQIRDLNLPEGFVSKKINFVIYGYCDKCSANI